MLKRKEEAIEGFETEVTTYLSHQNNKKLLPGTELKPNTKVNAKDLTYENAFNKINYS